jgi:hypothetical protein
VDAAKKVRYGHCQSSSRERITSSTRGEIIMLNSANGLQELDRVNMFIRALADEVAQTHAQNTDSEFSKTLSIEMEEALYELRLRKLLISALVDSDDKTISH